MTDQAISPLRRRMIEDMTIRKFAPKTQHDYVQRVKDFAAFLGRPPATASKEDVRSYQLHLASSGARTPKINSRAAIFRRTNQKRLRAIRSLLRDLSRHPYAQSTVGDRSARVSARCPRTFC
jgi:plasmid stabilization system protein ParE